MPDSNQFRHFPPRHASPANSHASANAISHTSANKRSGNPRRNALLKEGCESRRNDVRKRMLAGLALSSLPATNSEHQVKSSTARWARADPKWPEYMLVANLHRPLNARCVQIQAEHLHFHAHPARYTARHRAADVPGNPLLRWNRPAVSAHRI